MALTPNVYNTPGNPNLTHLNNGSGSTLSSPSSTSLGRTETTNGDFTVVKDGAAKVKGKAAPRRDSCTKCLRLRLNHAGAPG